MKMDHASQWPERAPGFIRVFLGGHGHRAMSDLSDRMRFYDHQTRRGWLWQKVFAAGFSGVGPKISVFVDSRRAALGDVSTKKLVSNCAAVGLPYAPSGGGCGTVSLALPPPRSRAPLWPQ